MGKAGSAGLGGHERGTPCSRRLCLGAVPKYPGAKQRRPPFSYMVWSHLCTKPPGSSSQSKCQSPPKTLRGLPRGGQATSVKAERIFCFRLFLCCSHSPLPCDWKQSWAVGTQTLYSMNTDSVCVHRPHSVKLYADGEIRISYAFHVIKCNFKKISTI